MGFLFLFLFVCLLLLLLLSSLLLLSLLLLSLLLLLFSLQRCLSEVSRRNDRCRLDSAAIHSVRHAAKVAVLMAQWFENMFLLLRNAVSLVVALHLNMVFACE